MKIELICPNCNVNFISEKRDRRKFCSHNCSASFNNKNRNRKKSKYIICLHCKIEFKADRSKQKYCSSECMGKQRSLNSYNNLLNNNLDNLSVSYTPKVAKKFILGEQDNKCAICNMNNIWNNREIIFILDHIDGNSINNKRENLRLVCPNCDSQLDTYKSKNKNSGRFYRRQRYKEGKSS